MDPDLGFKLSSAAAEYNTTAIRGRAGGGGMVEWITYGVQESELGWDFAED